MKFVKLALVSIFLIGCSPVVYRWKADGMTDRQFKWNEFLCRSASQTVDYIPATVPVYNNHLKVIMAGGLTTFPVASMDLDMYQACMEGSGLTLVEKK